MLLEHKIAVVYGGGGAIGGAAAAAFAREGARVFLAGRTLAKLERVARGISEAGGHAEIAELDALDEQAVNQHADAVTKTAGAIDIALNAVGIVHVQGPPFAELSLEDYLHPVSAYTRTNFITAKAVSRHMVKRKSGVIAPALSEATKAAQLATSARVGNRPSSVPVRARSASIASTPGSRMTGSGFLGYGVTCGAIETFSRILAGELGPSGIRVVCLRPDAIPEALPTSHSGQVFSGFAERAGTTVEAMLAERARTGTLLGRFPTLAEVANCAAFVASDRAGAMTGAIVNLTCGSVVD